MTDPTARPDRATFEVDGLGVTVEGEGAPLVLLHGFTGSGEAWPAGGIARLAARFRVHRIDLPGHGAARVGADDPEAWTPERTVDRLRRLEARIEGGPAHWIGYSMGGRLALLAATRGVPMRTLSLESASPGLATEDDRRARRELDETLAARILVEGIEAFVDHWTAIPLFESQHALPEEVRAAERARRLRNDPGGLAAALRGFGTGSQPALWSELPDLDLPVRLLTGELDPKFEAIARAMADRIPEARHRSIRGAGHAVHLEATDRWVDWILELADHSAP